MRRLATALVGMVLLSSAPVYAAQWSITAFSSDISIQPDSSIAVAESIEVNFNVSKHGIFRTIPVQYQTDSGSSVSVPLTVDSVKLDGQPVRFEESRKERDLVLKIGDPKHTLTGSHAYEITYRAQAAVNFFDDHDELYWNVTGLNWEVPISSASAIVRLPGSVPSSSVKVQCFVGSAYGSRSELCSAQAQESGARFSAQDFLTIVVGWPKGIVTKPENYDALRTSGTSSRQSSLTRLQIALIALGNVFLTLLIIVGFAWWWLRHGRDPKSRPTVMVQYDPPAGLRPGEVGTLYDETAQNRDVIATIVDLAVRGWVTIEEVSKDRFLGFGHDTDYTLMLNKEVSNDASLKPYERALLDSMFRDGTVVTLQSLKGRFYQDLQRVKSKLYEQLVTNKYFVSNPDTVRKIFFIAGATTFVLGFFLMPLYVFVVPVLGLAAVLTAKFMPQRTIKGVDATWHSRGFREYLEKAEKYRVQWQEKEHIFEQFLPYAMVFGVAEKWSKAFAGIAQQPPSWYRGSYPGNFNSLLLWSALNSMSGQTMRAFSPAAASGRSGFGGGGFGGGGIGGGGGGSW